MTSMLRYIGSLIAGIQMLLLPVVPASGMQPPDACPPLNAPTGPTVTVTTEAALRDQAYSAAPGTTIWVAAGTYTMQGAVQVVNDGVSLRGATGDRDDVVLDFGGMTSGHFGVTVEADDVTIADLTIRNTTDHGVQIQGRDRPVLYNLTILDTNDQLVKVNPPTDGTNGSDDGLLACSRLAYTTSAPDEYTNGISAHQAHNWTVRDNVWLRIRTATGTPAPTILFWSGSSDTIVERNTLIDCYQGIAFGNANQSGINHTGGIVRNNVIYAAQPHDVMIEMVRATGWLVAHNTLIGSNPAAGVTWSIEARFAESQGTFAYNLTNLDVWSDRDGAGAMDTGNVTTAAPGWFANGAPAQAEAADLHLVASATAAIDQAAVLAQVPTDIDGETRPSGTSPDVGADEYTYTPPPVLDQRLYLPIILRTYAPPAPPPTATPPVAVGLIAPTDLAYRGAFRLPADPEGMGWEWGGSALAYDPEGDPGGPTDGYPGSLFGTGHAWHQNISEIAIPAPLIPPDNNVSELQTAATLQPFTDVYGTLYPEMEIPRVGLAYLPAQGDQTTGKLYVSRVPHMGEGETNATHAWFETDLTAPQTAGLWRIGDYLNYVTTDYSFPIDPAWAAAHTPGLLLATGRFRDGGQGAEGPALFAIAPWQAGNPPAPGTTLDATPLLLYDDVLQENPVHLDGYHHSDDWSGGAWLTAGDKAAVLFVGTKGLGDCWYGCADGTDAPPWPDDCDRGWWSTSFVGRFLFYDPADLSAVARGEMATSAPQPYAALDVDDLLYHISGPMQKDHLGAAAFDRANRRLYVIEPFGDGDRPLVHVWEVADDE